MDWLHPFALLLLLPALGLLAWFDARSTHPMGSSRRRLLLVARSLLVLLALLAIASPAIRLTSREQSLILLLDHSRSQGTEGVARIYEAAEGLRSSLGGGAAPGVVAFGEEPRVLLYPGQRGALPEAADAAAIIEEVGAVSDFERAVTFAKGLFPSGASRHLVLFGDGVETGGSLLEAAKVASVAGIRIHARGVAGPSLPDVRVTRLAPTRSLLNEGATLGLDVVVEGSVAGPARIRLFENGIEVDVVEADLRPGEAFSHRFSRAPDRRGLYNYRALVEGFEGIDALPENNEALCLVDVRGQPLFLHVEGEEGEGRHLVGAMAAEGIRLESRSPEGLPSSVQDLAGYDGVILSDVPAHRLGEARMAALRDYVEKLGGGFVMVGGPDSFGVGGYYRTPVEELLPVKLKAPDQEETQSSALALVIDRSGSMAGQKMEFCKAAAVASAELLSNKDYLGVYAFDSQVHEIVPMSRVVSTSAVAAQIARIGSGGGTNIYPGMVRAREELNRVKARIRHMIVLTDGQTAGEGYQALASQCQAEGITISTVAVGTGAFVGLLQSIAAAGGGESYVINDPASIVRVFTQDTMTHTGRMVREDSFEPKFNERHPMLGDWEEGAAPPLLGYVKTTRKATAQVPLVTDLDDPLLAHWRFGLGKVTAFTSDCKSRWAALWVGGWDGYSRLWSQILRETARPPQGLLMDLRLEEMGSDLNIAVDLAEDASSRRDKAGVEAEIFHLAARSLGSAMRPVATIPLPQEGPGWYEGRFRPTEAGVYLIRARAGSQVASAGHVHNPTTETATGRINDALLRRACEITGGTYLEDADAVPQLEGTDVARQVELWPYLLMAFLALLLVDLVIRRWENLLGVIDHVRRLAGRTRVESGTEV
jgi:Ca-activated chloride channel family protein